MCGIAGFFNRQSNIPPDVMLKMLRPLARRGPNGQGTFFSEDNSIAFGHTRLAIHDLSSAGAQPWHSFCGNHILIFNGEIYNYDELRSSLSSEYSLSWSTSTDTEVLSCLISLKGIRATLSSIEGMFAFAVYDKLNSRIYLCTDRFGEKPIYYCTDSSNLIFASQITSLLRHPSCSARLNYDELSSFFQLQYIPYPGSIFEGISKIPPATILCFDIPSHQSSLTRYWSLDSTVGAPCPPISSSYASSIQNVDQILHSVIHDQLKADVPVGCFLSGGIDSSIVASIMQAQRTSPIHTFSIGFSQPELNEAHRSRRIASHLGTIHHELYPTDEDYLWAAESLPFAYDEPFADSSQIPTLLVSRLARQHVTVALSGDGGDELFGGYRRYFLCLDAYRKLAPFSLLSKLFNFLSGNSSQSLLRPLLTSLFHALSFKNPSHKARKLLSLLDGNFSDPSSLYAAFLVVNSKSSQHIQGLSLDFSLVLDDYNGSLVEKMMQHDIYNYLPCDILVKVDRASMFNSLESRAPLLNHRLYEYVWSLPETIRITRNNPKKLLKDVLARYLPRSLFEFPKSGFGVPLNYLLYGPLKEMALDYLSDASRRDYHSSSEISGIMRSITNQTIVNPYSIWPVFVLEQWRQSHHV